MPRIAQLTQKSNQFNLTTRRYTEAEIADLVDSPDATVYSLGVRDRFGDSGLTGVGIVRWDRAVAYVDTLLMSCRVLGREVERAPWPAIVADARARGAGVLTAEWLRTARNGQVERFFDALGLECVSEAPDRAGTPTPLDRPLPHRPDPHRGDPMSTDDKLRHVMSAVLRVPAGEIDDHTSPDTVEAWSSLAHLDLILAIEEEFGVTIPDEEVGDLTSYRLLRLTLDEQGVATA